MRVCHRCKKNKRLTSFYWQNKNIRRHYTCKVCQHRLDRSWYERNKKLRRSYEKVRRAKLARGKEDRFLEYLQGKSCADCGNSDQRVLEFDHVRSRKVCGVPRMIVQGYGWKNIAKEIAKCDLVCCNCHRIRTSKQFSWSGRRFSG